MANDVLYEVRVGFDNSSEEYQLLVFRKNLSLEQAVSLANSLWLSTDNELVSVSVCEVDGTLPCVLYHQRS